MKSEALRNTRTMRQVKTSLDIARSQRLRTTNSLSQTKEEIEHLASVTDRRRAQVLQKERRQFTAHQTAVNKSRQRVLRSRDRLAATINQNRALTELRHRLQCARWEREDRVSAKTGEFTPQPNLHQIELNY